jgi:uncharacterized HAD superfamily protein
VLKKHEISEAVLFTCRIMERQGLFKEAIEFLGTHDKYIIDQVKKTEYHAFFNEKCGNKEKAVEHYETLLQLNSANLGTYEQIFKAKGFNLPKRSSGERLSAED